MIRPLRIGHAPAHNEYACRRLCSSAAVCLQTGSAVCGIQMQRGRQRIRLRFTEAKAPDRLFSRPPAELRIIPQLRRGIPDQLRQQSGEGLAFRLQNDLIRRKAPHRKQCARQKRTAVRRLADAPADLRFDLIGKGCHAYPSLPEIKDTAREMRPAVRGASQCAPAPRSHRASSADRAPPRNHQRRRSCR